MRRWCRHRPRLLPLLLTRTRGPKFKHNPSLLAHPTRNRRVLHLTAGSREGPFLILACLTISVPAYRLSACAPFRYCIPRCYEISLTDVAKVCVSLTNRMQPREEANIQWLLMAVHIWDSFNGFSLYAAYHRLSFKLSKSGSYPSPFLACNLHLILPIALNNNVTCSALSCLDVSLALSPLYEPQLQPKMGLAPCLCFQSRPRSLLRPHTKPMWEAKEHRTHSVRRLWEGRFYRFLHFLSLPSPVVKPYRLEDRLCK
jgi:hypothetical protein